MKFLRAVSVVRCLLKQGVELTWSNPWERHPRMVDVLVLWYSLLRNFVGKGHLSNETAY